MADAASDAVQNPAHRPAAFIFFLDTTTELGNFIPSFIIKYARVRYIRMKNTIILLFLLLLPLRVWGVSAGIHTWAAQSALAEGSWVKVALNDTDDGIYQITYSQLRNWGFSNPSQVGVYGFGGHMLNESFSTNHIDDLPEVAIYQDTERQRILFYGRGLITWNYRDTLYQWEQRQHPYATSSCYFLHQKSGESPLQIDTKASSQAQPDVVLREYDECWLHEVETTNLGETGRQWYGESFLSSLAQNFDLTQGTRFEGHILKAGTALLTVNFVANAQSSSSFTVRLGSTTIGSKTIGSNTNTYGIATEATLNTRLTTTGSLNGATVGITYQPGTSAASAARLNYIRLQGKCDLEASSAEAFMLFRNIEAKRKQVAYVLRGINSKMQVWDVTSPNTIFRQELVGDTLFVPEQQGVREYAVVNLASNNFSGVSLVGNVKRQNLHSLEGINMVIVSAPAFVPQAERLAEYRRQHDQLSVYVVTPEQIYNEYSSGVADATAIRLFMKNLYEKGLNADEGKKLRYLLLFGDGTYNNRAATLSNYLLPCYESDASLVQTSSCVCDDYFGFLDDNEGGRKDGNGNFSITNDVLDISIGRLPVRNATQADDIVAKIISYDSNQFGSWKNRLCFLSDDDKLDTSGKDSPNLHMKHNDQLISILEAAGHNEFLYQKIYLPAYKQTVTTSGTDYPDARKEFNSVLQQGALIINYAGHGSTTGITHEMIMSSRLANQLRMKHLPVWITASCDVSRWDANDASMGEELLLNPHGGAAALISTTRVVYAAENLSLNKAITNHIFDRHTDGTRYRMGDILRMAKVDLGSNFNKLNFCLLGDPSMLLACPEQQMVIDSIKGDFSTLNTVTIHGHVLKLGGTEIDSTFHGLIYPTIFDAEEKVSADKGIWQSTSSDEEIPYQFMSRNRKVFSGRDYVRNGKFEFSFCVPMDLSGLPGNGLINLYACSEDGREGNGYYNQFQFKAATANVHADTLGPKLITCFLDDPDFKSGDAVGTTPFFYAEVIDESGINATGASVGHDVSLTIQCLSNPLITIKQYNLNSYFTTFTGQPTHGNVKYQLSDLEEGTYRAMFRIWDIYNNPTTVTFDFTVSDKTKPEIALMQAYPSPVKQGGTVTFRMLHNRPESADKLRVQVYTQTGVKVLDQTVQSNSCEAVYLEPDATRVTQISKQLNADETSQLMGSTTLQWTADVLPGVYLYRAYLSAGSQETASKSKLLIVY